MIINFLIICYSIQLIIFSVVIFKYLSGNSFKQIFLKHKLFKYFFPLTFMECVFNNQPIEYVLSTEYRLSENETLKKQLEALTKQNEELTLINHNYQVTVSTILSQGMSNDNVEQNEQEPVQKIR